MLQHEAYLKPAPAAPAGAKAAAMNGGAAVPRQMPTSNYAEWYSTYAPCRLAFARSFASSRLAFPPPPHPR